MAALGDPAAVHQTSPEGVEYGPTLSRWCSGSHGRGRWPVVIVLPASVLDGVPSLPQGAVGHAVWRALGLLSGLVPVSVLRIVVQLRASAGLAVVACSGSEASRLPGRAKRADSPGERSEPTPFLVCRELVSRAVGLSSLAGTDAGSSPPSFTTCLSGRITPVTLRWIPLVFSKSQRNVTRCYRAGSSWWFPGGLRGHDARRQKWNDGACRRSRRPDRP